MDPFTTLLQRNHDFAAHHFVSDLLIRPRLNTVILGCADPRVDPAHILGLEPGDAAILRNVGGRVTPGTLQLLKMLIQVPTQTTAPAPTPATAPFHLIVVQHTDCGIKRLASHEQLMAEYFGIAPAALPTKMIHDPQAAIRNDIAELRSTPTLPDGLLVSGLVYDTATGFVEVVVLPTPLRPTAQA